MSAATEQGLALTVPCPYCEAAPGKPCLTTSLKVERQCAHAVRLEAAKRAQKREAAARQRGLFS